MTIRPYEPPGIYTVHFVISCIFSDGVREFCLKEENFEAKCLKNEVIVVNSALYGRMRIGRCLEAEGHLLFTTMGSDPLFLGCSVNVLPLIRKKCFGKNHCEIRGQNDASLKMERPCHAALQNYLEVDYQCVTGTPSLHIH